MPRYLVTDSAELHLQALRLVEADSPEAAAERYMAELLPSGQEFLEYLSERSVNISFAESFWLRTSAENTAFNRDDTLLCSHAEFIERLYAAFPDRRDLAFDFAEYWMGDGLNDPSCLPKGFAVYVATKRLAEDFLKLKVIDLADIQSLD